MSLPTYDEVYAKAAEGSPFSNSTEGDAWTANNCQRCIHDKPARNDDYENACPILGVAYCGKTPAEWMRKEGFRLGDQYMCLFFRDEDNGGPGEPTPIPDPPGQDALFPRDGFERPGRMFDDTKPQEVSSHA